MTTTHDGHNMAAFADALNQRKMDDLAWTQAVNNILDDIRTPQNPHGLSAELMRSADQAMTAGSHLEQVVRSHRSIEQPDLHVEVDHVPQPQLRRVMSWHTFQKYHLALKGSLSQDAFADLDVESVPQEFDRTQLQGRTGRQNQPAWWTWRNASDTPANGHVYICELALSEPEHFRALSDRVVIEISIDRKQLSAALFRPTGLDAFETASGFRPNIGSSDPHGRTRPQPPALPENARPEVASRSGTYLDMLKPGATVTVIPIPYQTERV